MFKKVCHVSEHKRFEMVDISASFLPLCSWKERYLARNIFLFSQIDTDETVSYFTRDRSRERHPIMNMRSLRAAHTISTHYLLDCFLSLSSWGQSIGISSKFSGWQRRKKRINCSDVPIWHFANNFPGRRKRRRFFSEMKVCKNTKRSHWALNSRTFLTSLKSGLL